MSDVPGNPLKPLVQRDLHTDPMQQFDRWYRHAKETLGESADQVALATVTQEGKPDVRMVLLKGYDRAGFRFFTNLGSSKGGQLQATPSAALAFYWEALGWQVRVRGEVVQLPPAESEAYFATRPRGSQLGAWASRQSHPLKDREELERAYAGMVKRFKGRRIPRPAYWAGFNLVPKQVEFWQAGENRLHDRFLYTLNSAGGWSIQRLSP